MGLPLASGLGHKEKPTDACKINFRTIMKVSLLPAPVTPNLGHRFALPQPPQNPFTGHSLENHPGSTPAGVAVAAVAGVRVLRAMPTTAEEEPEAMPDGDHFSAIVRASGLRTCSITWVSIISLQTSASRPSVSTKVLSRPRLPYCRAVT